MLGWTSPYVTPAPFIVLPQSSVDQSLAAGPFAGASVPSTAPTPSQYPYG